MPESEPEPGDSLNTRELTWAALLGRWVEFARSAVALPPTETGRRLRESVQDLIMLQAVTCALGELEQVDEAERQLGLDRAELLIDRHAEALKQRWQPDPLPERVAAFIADARSVLAETQGPSRG